MEKNNQIARFCSSQPRLALLVSGFFPIVFALISQYGFGLHPCELCIYQRTPFFAVIGFAVIALAFKNNIKLFKLLLILSISAFLINSGIAFFHVGVEKKWWVYGECSAQLDMTSIESLKKALFEAPSVRCDDVQFSFLGVSMAGWNVVYSIFASIYFIVAFKKLDKK